MFDSPPATRPGSSSSPIGWAVLFLITAAVLVGVGFNTMYSYGGPEEGGKIVGGDAYNYIIIATRGVGFIGAGIVSALVGVCSLLIGVFIRTAPEKPAPAPASGTAGA